MWRHCQQSSKSWQGIAYFLKWPWILKTFVFGKIDWSIRYPYPICENTTLFKIEDCINGWWNIHFYSWLVSIKLGNILDKLPDKLKPTTSKTTSAFQRIVCWRCKVRRANKKLGNGDTLPELNEGKPGKQGSRRAEELFPVGGRRGKTEEKDEFEWDSRKL